MPTVSLHSTPFPALYQSIHDYVWGWDCPPAFLPTSLNCFSGSLVPVFSPPCSSSAPTPPPLQTDNSGSGDGEEMIGPVPKSAALVVVLVVVLLLLEQLGLKSVLSKVGRCRRRVHVAIGQLQENIDYRTVFTFSLVRRRRRSASSTRGSGRTSISSSRW